MLGFQILPLSLTEEDDVFKPLESHKCTNDLWCLSACAKMRKQLAAGSEYVHAFSAQSTQPQWQENLLLTHVNCSLVKDTQRELNNLTKSHTWRPNSDRAVPMYLGVHVFLSQGQLSACPISYNSLDHNLHSHSHTSFTSFIFLCCLNEHGKTCKSINV